MMKRSAMLFLLLLNLVNYSNLVGQSPILDFTYEYQLDLKELTKDQLKVSLSVPELGEDTLIFCFPKIVPGIYGAMDFGQYIKDVRAENKRGKSLKVKQVDENCWQIYPAQNLTNIQYIVDDSWEKFDFYHKNDFYRSAASTFSEESLLLNNNCLFGYFRGMAKRPFSIQIDHSRLMYGATSLTRDTSTVGQDQFWAKDYHELVDNPILYSGADTTFIRLPQIEIEVAVYSTTHTALSKEIAEHIKPLLINQTKYLDGKLPVSKYTFLIYHNLNSNADGYMADGLEHSNSTVILLYTPWDVEVFKDMVYRIASHEFFHTLMPLALHSEEIANYDFNEPKMSRHLWLYEGTTEYFTIHMPIRNGIQSLEKFRTVLEGKIKEMRKYKKDLSLTELSLNAMDMQAQYYNVYLKGALLNLCLDIYLRELSQGDYGMQNLIAELIGEYGKDKAFQDDQLFSEIIRLSGYQELEVFFEDYVKGTKPLPLEKMLNKVGLRLKSGKVTEIADPSSTQLALRKSWIGQ